MAQVLNQNMHICVLGSLLSKHLHPQSRLQYGKSQTTSIHRSEGIGWQYMIPFTTTPVSLGSYPIQLSILETFWEIVFDMYLTFIKIHSLNSLRYIAVKAHSPLAISDQGAPHIERLSTRGQIREIRLPSSRRNHISLRGKWSWRMSKLNMSWFTFHMMSSVLNASFIIYIKGLVQGCGNSIVNALFVWWFHWLASEIE